MIWSLHREPFQKLIRSRPPPALKDSIDDMLVTEEDKIAALAALKETEVFECLTPRQLRVLVSAMQPIQLSKDECVVKQGEDIVEFFLIVSGELSCRVVQNGADSKEVLRLRPGQHFGERALIGSQGKKVAAKSSIVVASEHSRLLKISSKAFTSALGATMGDLSISFEFWMGLMEAMAIAVTTRNARMTKLFDSGIPFSSLSTKGLLLSLDCSALMFMESPPCQAGVNDGPKEVVVAARLTSVMDATAMGKQAQVLRARAITRSLEPGPFIPSPIKTYKDETVLAEILSSPLPLCTLESILSPLAPLDEESAAFLAASIAIGLEQLHRSGVLYRGLSLDTVAVTEGGLAQLLDFRYARQDDGRAFTLCGSHPEFLAPEIILGRSPAESSDPTKSETGQSEAADAWAFGVVVSSMLNGGQTPFSSPGDDELRAYRKIVCLPPNLPSHISAPARDLLVALLQKEPSKRLGRALGLIEALMAHPWFSGIDWVALAEQRLPTPPGLKERLDAFEGVETAEFVPSPCPLPQAAWINEF